MNELKQINVINTGRKTHFSNVILGQKNKFLQAVPWDTVQPQRIHHNSKISPKGITNELILANKTVNSFIIVIVLVVRRPSDLDIISQN